MEYNFISRSLFMLNDKVLIASDHVGVPLKRFIIDSLKTSTDFIDIGTDSLDRCNYNDYASSLSEQVRSSTTASKGILICGTGIGMSIAANRHRGIRAVVCSEPYSAVMSRKHNNSNVLCLGSRVLGFELAKHIVDQWLATDFEGGRHTLRLNTLDQYS